MRSYTLAGADDDATLRSLLRENLMPSWVALSLEREPSYFAGRDQTGRDWTVLAREGSIPVGMYACSEQLLHVNGAPLEAGYLNSLRVRAAYRNKPGVLRDGFASIRGFRQARGPELWFTSIAHENRAARRLLEANLAGMPRYQFLNELVTLVIARSRQRKASLWRPIAADELHGVCSFHNARAQRFNLSARLTPESAARTGAPCFVVERGGKPVACMILWNQQSYRQAVVRGYRRPLGFLRPAYNAYARATRRVALPRVGEALDSTFLAYFVVADSAETGVETLIEDALCLCPTKLLLLALHDANPWLPGLRAHFRPEQYRTRIYTVGFDEGNLLDARPAQPDAALL